MKDNCISHLDIFMQQNVPFCFDFAKWSVVLARSSRNPGVILQQRSTEPINFQWGVEQQHKPDNNYRYVWSAADENCSFTSYFQTWLGSQEAKFYLLFHISNLQFIAILTAVDEDNNLQLVFQALGMYLRPTALFAVDFRISCSLDCPIGRSIDDKVPCHSSLDSWWSVCVWLVRAFDSIITLNS